AAPSRGLETETTKRARNITSDYAETHHADRDLARRRLIMRAPQPLALLRVVEPLAPMVHQRMQNDIFGDARGEVGMCDARDRNTRQRRIGEQLIDARAEIDDRLEVWKSREQTMRRIPDTGIRDIVRIADRMRPD